MLQAWSTETSRLVSVKRWKRDAGAETVVVWGGCGRICGVVSTVENSRRNLLRLSTGPASREFIDYTTSMITD